MNAVCLLRPLLTPAAQKEPSARFDRVSIRSIIEDAFVDYESQRAGLSREASAGGRVMVNLAALTIGLSRALLRRGISEDEARSPSARTTSKIYSETAAAPTALSRLGTRSPRSRVKRAKALFRRFLFSQPFYVMVDVDGGNDVVAFEVHRCPVVEYLRAHDLGDLRAESWCDLDLGLAKRWGSTLERTATLLFLSLFMPMWSRGALNEDFAAHGGHSCGIGGHVRHAGAPSAEDGRAPRPIGDSVEPSVLDVRGWEATLVELLMVVDSVDDALTRLKAVLGPSREPCSVHFARSETTTNAPSTSAHTEEDSEPEMESCPRCGNASLSATSLARDGKSPPKGRST